MQYVTYVARVSPGDAVRQELSKFRWVYTYMGCETDAMTAAAMKKVMFKFFNNADGDGPTEAQPQDSRERDAKHQSVSAVASAVMFLSEKFNRTKLRAILASTLSLHGWYKKCKGDTRSIEGCAKWWREQFAERQFFIHINNCAQGLDLGSEMFHWIVNGFFCL